MGEQEQFDKLKEKYVDDPMLEEFKFCDNCLSKALDLVTHIREQENAMIVAKEALETQNWAIEKLTFEAKGYRALIDKLKEKVDNKQRCDINRKMKDLDAQYQKFENRNKLIVS